MPETDHTMLFAHEGEAAPEMLHALESTGSTWALVTGPSCEHGPGWEERMLALAGSRRDVGCGGGSVRAFRGARSAARWYEGAPASFPWYGSARSHLADLTQHAHTGISPFLDGRGLIVRTDVLRAALTAAPKCSSEGLGLVVAAVAHARRLVCLCDSGVYVAQNGPAADDPPAQRVRHAENLAYDVMVSHAIWGGSTGLMRLIAYSLVGQTSSPGLLQLPIFVSKRPRFEVWRAATRGRWRALLEIPRIRTEVLR